MDKSLLLAQKEQAQMLPAFDEVLLFSLERRYLEFSNVERLEMTTNPLQSAWDYKTHLRMMKVEEVSYEGDVRAGLHLLNMQNVLAAMKDDSQNVVSFIHSSREKTSLYYGLSKRVNVESDVSTHEYADVLRQTMHGNFLGVKMRPLSAEETFDEVLAPMGLCTDIRAFPGIPSLRLKDPQGPYVQGIDRFIEGMRGEEYCLVTIAEPIPLATVDAVIKNLFDLSSEIHSQVKATIQKMKGSSDTVNVGMFGMSGISAADTTGTADTTTISTSETDGTANTTGKTTMGGGGVMQSVGSVLGGALGSLAGPLGIWIGSTIGGGIGSLLAWGTQAALSNSTSSTTSHATMATRAQSFTRSVSNTIGRMTGLGGQGGYARGWNRSHAVTQEVLNKTAEYCEKLCDAYIERLQAGKNLGLWNVGVYLLTDSRYTQLRAQGLLRAAFSGDTTYWEPMRTAPLNNKAIAQYLMNFNNPRYNLFLYGEEKSTVKGAVTAGQRFKEYARKIGASVMSLMERLNRNDEGAARMLEEIRRCPGDYSKEDVEKAWGEIKKAELGHPFGDIMGGVSTPLNTEELSIIMNVPRQEVQGITIREAAPFGVNYVPEYETENIRLGRVVHKRMPMDDIPYVIPCSLFKKHAFVCGVTGSGKTNTCMALLRGLNLPFLVVEPAKTEYRQMLNFMPNLKIFTLGSETVSPFRINPFEFTPGSELLTHIDSIKAVFNAAFPMYASMPYILEEAIIEMYRDKGWDLAMTTNRYLDDLHGPEFFDYIPTLQDLYDKIGPIVKRKAYAQEQTENIQAALMARLSSLLTGSKGLMLNTKRSTPLSQLLEEPVILELKNIGDDDEKCFIMGLILASIYQYRENSGGLGNDLKHVLLFEEAHRLLRRTPEFVSPEIGNSRGKAVETFTNVISEIREYGQGVVIVDQIPSKLTPDVVKNTNIKIIHRTLAQDDREYVGSTMNLTEAQDRELCLLEVGRAVVHREGMDKAFLVQIDPVKGDLKPVTNEMVHEHMKGFFKPVPRCYGLERKPGLAEAFNREDFRRQSPNLLGCMAAALLALMTEGPSAMGAVNVTFNSLLKHDLGVSGVLREDCHAVYNANLLFERLQEKFNGNYRACMHAQRFFIDAWFGETIDVEEFRRAIAEFTNVVEGEDPYVGVLQWIVSVNDFRHSNTGAIVNLAFAETVNFGELDRLLREVLYSILCGHTLPKSAESAMLTVLLDELLAHSAGYYMKTVVRSYGDFLKDRGLK